MHQFGRTARGFVLIAGLLFLGACGDDAGKDSAGSQIIRGLKTVVVQDEERATERKYPGVLQPSSISALSFEIAGKLAEINLTVGQRVKKGEVLARIDATTLNLQVASSEAALQQAESSVRTTEEDDQRKKTLLKKGVIANAVADKSRDAAEQARAELVQAQSQLETARENLKKAELKSPFDGFINTVSVDAFTNVAAGNAIASVYSARAFEVSFSVSYDVSNLLVVGKKAVVRLADDPGVTLAAHVSELGSRADVVSSFPVVVELNGTDIGLKAGMAVEVSMEFPVANGGGFALPLTVLALEGQLKEPDTVHQPGEAFVYVFDPATDTVNRRAITIAGVRENALIVVDGLHAGELVASAGVSFLHDGQKVKLLPVAVGN